MTEKYLIEQYSSTLIKSWDRYKDGYTDNLRFLQAKLRKYKENPQWDKYKNDIMKFLVNESFKHYKSSISNINNNNFSQLYKFQILKHLISSDQKYFNYQTLCACIINKILIEIFGVNTGGRGSESYFPNNAHLFENTKLYSTIVYTTKDFLYHPNDIETFLHKKNYNNSIRSFVYYDGYCYDTTKRFKKK